MGDAATLNPAITQFERQVRSHLVSRLNFFFATEYYAGSNSGAVPHLPTPLASEISNDRYHSFKLFQGS